MASPRDAFAGWTIAHLQAYVRDCGRDPDEAATKGQLITMAVAAAQEVEGRVAQGESGGGAATTLSVPPPLPPASPSRRALLVGCNYAGTRAALQGCVNDAHCLRHLLVSRLGFSPESITLLTDDAPDPRAWPTRSNVLWHAHALAAGAGAGDSLFFSFSGHGSQSFDPTGDEGDSMNETLLPCDHEVAGQIVDDELNAGEGGGVGRGGARGAPAARGAPTPLPASPPQALINPVPAGARLHALIDACHSGSALDLEWMAKARPAGAPLTWKQTYSRAPSVHKGTAGGLAVQVAASRDAQVAADTSALSGSAHTGAATFAFIHAVETYGASISYGALLSSMKAVLDSVTGGSPADSLSGALGSLGGLLSGALDKLGMSGQTPVLCANWAFDLGTPLNI